jgi:hypothetical protein
VGLPIAFVQMCCSEDAGDNLDRAQTRIDE